MQFAQVLATLALDHFQAERFNRAEPLLREAITLLEETRSQKTEMYAVCKQRLGLALTARLEFGAARAELEQAVELIKSYYGEQSHQYIEVLFNLANCYSHQESYDRSLEVTSRAAKMVEAWKGVSSIEYAFCQANLALAYSGKGQFAEAVKANELAMNLYKSCNVSNNVLLVKWTAQQAKSIAATGNIKDARELIDQAVKIDKDRIGRKDSVQYAELSIALGEILFEANQLKEAEAAIDAASDIFRKWAIDKANCMAQCLDLKAKLATKNGKPEVAADYACEADKLRQRNFDRSSPAYAQHLERYTKYLRAANRVDEAKAVESRLEQLRKP